MNGKKEFFSNETQKYTKVKVHLGKHNSHEKTMDKQLWKTCGMEFHGK